MAISDTQKVDYLWKKIGYAATKTDTVANKEGFNEAIPSPLQIRGDKVMTDSGIIPATIPGANTSIVSVYTTSLPIECTNDATASTNRTWKTNTTDWISPEFGSTYQVKVYVNLSNSAGNAASAGTQLFAAGSGNSDEWFFDYQSGVLHFIGTNLPNGVSFTGKSVYVSGAEYIGGFGVSAPGSSGSVGNLTISNVTISANSSAVSSSANIIFSTSGTGAVQFAGNNAIGLPVGNIANRPTRVNAGYLRFNTEFETIEVWDGAEWVQTSGGVITSDVLNGDGSTAQFALSANTTTTGVLVSINGTIQKPSTAYTVSNNSITFTEIPALGDSIEVRKLAGGTISVNYGNADVATFLSTYSGLYSNVQALTYLTTGVAGNIIPSANVTYSLGSPTRQWRDLFVSNNTIYIGGIPLSIDASGNLLVNGSQVQGSGGSGGTNYSNVNVSALITTNGLTNYSNVNTAAYTTAMGYQNFGNVNVAAYVTTANSAVIGYVDNKVSTANIGVIGYIDLANTIQSNQITAANLGIKGYIDNSTSTANIGMKGYVDSVATLSSYSNVNVSALITTNGLTNYSNVNVVAYLAGNITVGNITTAGSILAVPAWTSAGNITITATTTNPGKGTTTFDNISYRQLGAKQWEVVMTYVQTATNGTAGTGDYLITLPNSLSFDTTLPSQQITTTNIGTNTYDLMTYIIPSGSGLINQGAVGGQVYPLVYNATKFRILTTSYGSAIQCWGSGYYALGGDDPKIQLTFRFTST